MSKPTYRLLPEEDVIPSREQRALVAALPESSTLLDVCPAADGIDVWIGRLVDEGSSLADAHGIWKPRAILRIDAIHGLPFRETEENCPGGLTRIRIDSVERRAPGMGSFFGFKGYFLGLLANPGDLSVWDARGEPAS